MHNPDGTLGLFLSGAYAADGDSDAFNQIFYSSSKDGVNWSAPQKLLGTDYTFSALAQQAANGGALGVSGYYSGRVYDPTVVQNRNGTLTMLFSGYSTPKPLPTTGSSIRHRPGRAVHRPGGLRRGLPHHPERRHAAPRTGASDPQVGHTPPGGGPEQRLRTAPGGTTLSAAGAAAGRRPGSAARAGPDGRR